MRDARPDKLVLGNINLPIPAFFPSVSTVKTALDPGEYLALLYSLKELKPRFLVSAFDLARYGNGTISEPLNRAYDAGVTVLMDSGNYESYWKGEQSRWTQQDYHRVLRQYPCNIAFGFDEQNPPDDEDAHPGLIIDRWRRDQEAAGDRIIIPIIHGNAQRLPDLCLRVVLETQVPMIAVAERRLGNGVIERAQTVMALRDALNASGRYVGLHLLGTGNPISIALYSLAGADSFDGLEWCQTVVDHESALLFHFSHSDFFRHQTTWSEEDISFQSRTLAHNLEFYADWMRRLRLAIHNDDAISFCRFNFPQRIFGQCASELGWE